MQRRTKLRKVVRAVTALVAVAMLAGACGSGSDSATGDGGSGGDASTDDGASGALAPEPGDPMAGVEAFTPSSTFVLEDAESANSLAVSPDGTMLAVAFQESLGETATIRIYDLATNEVTQTTTLDVISFGLLTWMADNRLVASARTSENSTWRSFDGATLDPLSEAPLDIDCAGITPDKFTGAIYTIDQIGDDRLCRVDTITGETTRSADGALRNLGKFWVRPGTGEVLALHSPTDETSELATLDGATFEETDALEVSVSEQVQIVGATAWIENRDDRSSRLEPGSIPAPDLSDLRHVSSAGTVFATANGNDDNVFVSAVDGTVLGFIPAGMNPTMFSDWSLDDSVYVRLDSNRGVEVYMLGS